MFVPAGGFDAVPARGQHFFGAPIGILMLDCTAPFIPGSVGNASTFTAPVRYRRVPGLTVAEILSSRASDHADEVTGAARELSAEGARMITANCGFMARYQRSVRAAVDVPVLLSSLLLVPVLQGMLPTHRKLGVVTASSQSMTPEFLAASALDFDADRLVIAGLDAASAFDDAFIACVGTADIPAIEKEVVTAARGLVADEPAVGCLLLECSELPPYAAAVQRATGIPVFDFTSMIEFFAAGLRRTAFDGFF
jgi:hypothetical protein